MRLAVLILSLGGCLIVDTYEENPGEVCPATKPDVLTAAAGAATISGDQIYYIRTPHVLSRIATSGGAITDLATVDEVPLWLVVDASYAYWSTPTHAIARAALTGGTSMVVADSIAGMTNLAVDDTGIVYAANGLYRIRHADNMVETVADGELISGLAYHGGTYFFADVGLGVIRRAPPVVDLATAVFPGPVVADDLGVYYYDHGELQSETAGAIRLVDPDGSPPVATIENMRGPVVAMVMDADNLYFATNVEGDYRIKRVSRSGGDVTRLACVYTEDAQVYLAQDAEFLYWSDAKQIYRIAKSGSN